LGETHFSTVMFRISHTVNLCPYGSYRQLALQQGCISSEQFTSQTRWFPSCPPHMIAWIQNRLTTSLHQRWTPTQYLKSYQI